MNFVASISSTGSGAEASPAAVTTSWEVSLLYVAEIMEGGENPTTASGETGSASDLPFQFSAAATLYG